MSKLKSFRITVHKVFEDGTVKPFIMGVSDHVDIQKVMYTETLKAVGMFRMLRDEPEHLCDNDEVTG